MANRVEVFQTTIAAGTAKANPSLTPLPFNDGQVEEIQIVVPRGPSGLVGFQIAYAGQQVIPNTAGAFLVSDDEKITWTVENLPEGGQWGVRAYNTDVYPHTLYLRFLVTDFGVKTSSLAIAPAFAIPAFAGSDVSFPQ